MTRKKENKSNEKAQADSTKALVLSIADYLKKIKYAPDRKPVQPTGEEKECSVGEIINLDNFRKETHSRASFLSAIEQLEETLAQRILWAEKQAASIPDKEQ
jgi:hypothetical protein